MGVIFNKGMPLEAAHMVVAAYVVGGFLVASVYAMGMLRGRNDRYHRLGFTIAFTVAAIATPIQLGVGDSLTRWVYENQPVKFAAIELVPQTEDDAPETLLGHLNSDGTVSGGLPIPGMASWLSDPSTGTATVVQGLDTVPVEDQPTIAQINTVHLAWDVMIGLGTALFLLSAFYGGYWLLRRQIPRSRWFLRLAAASGVLSVITMEAGWVVTEVGRQPWIVYDYMKVEDAATGNTGVWITFFAVVALYIGLGVTTILVLRGMSRRFRRQTRVRRVGRALRAQPEPAGRTGRTGRRGPGAMSTVVAVVLFIGVTAYALFGGADFGAGIWDLLAGGTERGERPRSVIDHSIGPVWEANHVWLIFCFVVLWSSFPAAYSSITLTLFVPLTIAALGIVLRGSGFAFRKAVLRTRDRRNFGAAFAISSVIVPFCMGAVAGAIATGRVPAGGVAGDPWHSWVNPTSMLGGVLAVVTVAYLSAVYLVWDAQRFGDAEMAAYFHRRALISAVVAGVVAFAGIFVLHADAPYLYDGLTSRALPLVLLSAVCGIGSLVLLLRGAHRYARILSIGAVAVGGPRVGGRPVAVRDPGDDEGVGDRGALGHPHRHPRGVRAGRGDRAAVARPPLRPRPEEPAPGRGGRGDRVELEPDVDLEVAEAARLLLGHRHGDRVLVEVGDGVTEVVEQDVGQVAADVLAHQDALHGDVGRGAGERVGGHLPAPDAQPVGQVVERVAGIDAVGQLPGDGRDAGLGVAVAEELERPQLHDLLGQVAAGGVGGRRGPAGSPRARGGGSRSTARRSGRPAARS